MNKARVLEYCKYHANGACQYKREFAEKLDALSAANKSIEGLQPRCPKDAQRNFRGIHCCIVERRHKLC